MRRPASWSAAHRWLVVSAWLFAIAGVQLAAVQVGSDFRNSFALPGTDSQAAVDLLDEHFPEAAGDADTIVFTASGGLQQPEVQRRVGALVGDVAELPSVAMVRGPFAPGGPPQVNADGTVGYATVQYDRAAAEVPREDLESLLDLVDNADSASRTDSADLQVAVAGQGVANLAKPKVGAGELVGVAVAALVLLLALRAPAAAVLPIGSAVAALGVATAVVRLASNVTTINDVAPTLGVLLGLGVGIDYALFIVNRHRGHLRAGVPVRESVTASLDTSGRAVVFAGVTVVVALLGMLVTGIEFLRGLAIGASVAVAFTVLASTTLVPALLDLLGLRALSRRERRSLASGDLVAEHAGGGFRRWAALVQRRPVALVGIALVALLTIAAPVTDLRLGVADQGNDPAGTTTRRAYDALAEGFGPGVNGPLLLAVDLSGTSDGGQKALADLTAGLKADPAVVAITEPRLGSDGSVAVLRVVPKTSPQDPATSDLIQRVREQLAPSIRSQTQASVHVGGPTATFDDFAAAVQSKIPLFVGVVVGVSFLLLLLAFRSLLVPALGAALNLLSVAAAFGVVVAVFQWGWFAELIGLGKSGPIEPFLPVVLFALLFGLSMDYQVFLVSRMREEWLLTGDNGTAVRTGHADSGRVIVAAASIMVFVFGAFVSGDSRTIKLMGLGMAAAVLLDAFVIRMLVVPALMHRLGAASWWLPRWLDRLLPHVSVEGDPLSGQTPRPAAVDAGAEAVPQR